MTLQEIIDYEKDYSYQDGLRVGIQGIIRTYQNFNQTKDKTVEALVRECGITEDEAKEYIRLYWQEENVTK